MPGATAPSAFGFTASTGSAPAGVGSANYFSPTYNAALPTPGASSYGGLYNPGAFSAGGFAVGSNFGNSSAGISSLFSGGPTTGGGSFSLGLGGGAPSRPGAQRIGNYTFYHPDRPLNWTEYGPKAPSWPVIRNSMPHAVQSPLGQLPLTDDQRHQRNLIMAKYSQNYRHPGYGIEMAAWHAGLGRNTGAPSAASPVPTSVNPSAFDALGDSGTSQYIQQLIASIQGQPRQTLGWFESGVRPAQLFGLSY